MPLSCFASLLHLFVLCRREASATPRRHRLFAWLLSAVACSFLPLAAQVAPTSSQVTPTSSLGDAQAARLRARHFLAGRHPLLPASGATATPVVLGSTREPRAAILPSPRAATVSSLSSSWSPLGPATVSTALYGAVSGRVTSIALDPNDSTGNTVWLGTTGGGVWKSANAAGSVAAVRFAPLTDTLPAFTENAGTSALPSLSIGAVSVQPAVNPVVLAGTGDPNDATDSYYGQGILRSADQGQTWTLASRSYDGANGHHLLTGLATAGFAWSTTSSSLVVAAMSLSAEGAVVGAQASSATPGLYFSTDAGVTWQMAIVTDGASLIQAPTTTGVSSVGAAATAVVWDPQRQIFIAALQFHGYYSSPDGQNWTRLANQPGAGLTGMNCPAGINGQGSLSCPMLRGSLAVQPVTGDLYALTVDANDNDQGLWQDLCNAGSNGQCSTAAPVFATRLDGGAFEAGQGQTNASTQIPQGSYNLTLAAVPAAANATTLFVGTIDLYRCMLSAGATACSFRNTTNAGNGCNATSAVAPAQHALAGLAATGAQSLLFLGNDGGLWRSTDGVAQSGPACASTDAAHFQNLNTAIGIGGSLGEIVGFAQDPSQPGTLIAGLGALGSAAGTSTDATAAWAQLAEGEGGFPQIDAIAPANWYVATGAGVNLKGCTLGAACTSANFTGSSDIGAVQTGYDTALLDAPTLLDPQDTANVLTGTCRVWRGPAQGGSAWTALNALSPSLDGGATPCTPSSGLVRSLAAGGPIGTTGSAASLGSEVLYAGMAGTEDGGGVTPGHLFVQKAAQTANSSTSWTDVTGSPVQGSSASFNASGFDLSSVVVDPHDATGGTVYATIMGFGVGPHVYRSLDFGAHWINLTANLPDAPANSLVVDPNDANTVYVAMDTGVYVTSAVATCITQNCWSLLGTALPNAPVTQLQAGVQLSTGDGRVGMLRAGTYGRGLWQTPLLTAHSLVQPQLSTSPGSLMFLAQPVGTQSDALTVTLLSYGNVAADVSSIVITGDFTETDTCSGQSIPVNGNCTVSVRFTPTATGGRSGLLTVYANTPGGQVTVALNGTGTAAATVVLTPLQVSFGPTLIHQTAAAQIVTVSNTGGNTASLQAPTITGDFAILANTCGASLSSQTGCSLSLGFTPTASGTRSGVLTISDSAGVQTAQLVGTGQSPATDTLAPASLSFSQQQVGTTSAAQKVILANAGDVPLTLITAVVVGTDFTAANSCGTSLAQHSSCAVSVAFAPTATGARTATLQVTDQFRTQVVPLSGAGLAPPGVSLSPSVLSFGYIGVGQTSPTSTVVLTNNGGVPLQIAATAMTGDFSIAASTCGVTLQPSAACNLAVSFSPTLPGAQAGSLTLTDNAQQSKQVVTLSGTGVDFSLQANGATAVTVASGSIATFPLKLTSVAGLSGTVAFSCTGAPANAACTVNPSPAQLGGTVLVSVTVQTGVATSARITRPERRVPGRAVLLCFFTWPALLAFRRSRRTLASVRVTVIACCLLLPLAAGLFGCGSTRLIPLSGGGGGGGGGGVSQPTAPGSYSLQVTGTADGVSHAVSMNLSVN